MSLSDQELKSRIAECWSESSATYDDFDGHGIRSFEERDAWKYLFKRVFPGDALKIMDVGCGTGEMGMVLAEMGHDVTGLDLSEKMIDRAQRKAREQNEKISFKVGDAENPPFDEGTFDAIVTRHVLWTLPHPYDALAGWQKVLKKGGRAVVIDGIWDDGSVGTRLRHALGGALMKVTEGGISHKGDYSKELNAELPNARGTPPERVRDYFTKAGFSKVISEDISHIRKIQRRYMTIGRRVSSSYQYYMTYGEK